MESIYNLSSKGMLPKKIITKGNFKYLIKYSSINCNESLIEVIVSKLLDLADIEHVEYKYYGLKDDIGYKSHTCLCKYIETVKSVRKVNLYDYCCELSYKNGILTGEISDSTIIDIICEFDYNIKQKIFQMLHIDAIIGNTDRNYTNIDLLVKDNNIIDIFPIFDNGASLLHDKDIFGKYSMDFSLPSRITHKSQINLIKELGYFGDLTNKFKSFKSIKELELLGDYKNTVIEYFYERLKIYGKV